MQRRTVLAAAGTTFGVSLVGCLDGRPDSEPTASSSDPENKAGEYEECHLIEIRYEWLPEDVSHEVDIALESGSYGADRLLFAEAVDTETSYLVVDEVPFEPIVETTDDTATLELHEADTVRKPDPEVITVRNEDDHDHEIHVKLTGEETVVDETVTLRQDEETGIEATDRFGTYSLSASVLTGHEATEDGYGFSISDGSGDPNVVVTADGLQLFHSEVELDTCQWDVTVSRTQPS